jgi:uncharacterized protein (TIGR04255 family)
LGFGVPLLPQQSLHTFSHMSSDTVRVKYRRPPLVEAVVEFRFSRTGDEWDSVYFGKIHDQLRDFPKITTMRGIEVTAGGRGGDMALATAPEIKRFATNEGGFVVTIAPTACAFSILPRKRPQGHPGWPELWQLAWRLYEAYRSVSAPQQVLSVGVRYINAIPVDPGRFVAGAFLTDSNGVVPSALLQEQNPFAFRLERSTEEGQSWKRQEAIMILARPAGASGELVLDVDEIGHVAEASEEEVNLSDVSNVLHDRLHEVFRTVIRHDVLDRFDPVTEEVQ